MEIHQIRSVRKRWTRVFDHVGTILLSILMGLIVWLIAINQENPLIVREFPDRITIRLRGLPDTLQPTTDLSKESVRVTLRAPNSAWLELQPVDINAYVDLSGLEPGVHDVPVQVEVTNPSVVVTEVQREQLRIQLDQVITKTVPVRVEVVDAAAFGYDSLTPIVNPSQVTVRGPSSQVEQIESAETQVNLRSARSQVERIQGVTLTDTARQPVDRVEVEPRLVTIVVPVERWPFRKEVAVRVDLVGQPAPGYVLSTVNLDPATVVLRGQKEVLDEVPGFVETSPFSVDGAKADLQRTLDLLLPEGVTAFEGDKVSVRAGISPVEGARTIKLKPVLRNIGAGLQATFALDTVDVIVAGPLVLLDALGPDDMFVILDLADLLPGTHTITPTVVRPPGIAEQGVIPAKIEVVISIKPTPDLIQAGPGTLPPGPTGTATPVANSPLVVTPTVTVTVTPAKQ